MDVVVDTYAWIEVLRGSERGREAARIIKDADTVYTPSIVLAEIARKIVRDGGNVEDAARIIGMIEDSSIVVCIDSSLAAEAAKIWMELREKASREGLSKPSLVDAIVLAVARSRRARLLTGDRHFKGLPEIIWLGG